ncbi:PD-(D/E)XK nuclease family protein [Halomontanus rarus]|uniref:PD-(D/E)XK nuclease family protein n=1 Tax=Halomontanus rarus TaxID=3034020 RepID=UPI0023E85ACE|nr:PD-(D/E)XK nuclease family protein [Halovivax sp. TS33]
MSDGRPLALSADGLETYLRCPRRYEFARVHELADGEDDPPAERRLDLCRQAICDALRTGRTDADGLETAAFERFETLWSDRDERYHSFAQRRHERRVLEATIRAYVEAFGAEHAGGLAELRADAGDGELIGPHLPLSSTVRLPERETTVEVDAAVDYVVGGGSTLTGVRFVPTLAPLGVLRYRDEWEGDVAGLFANHFDSDEETFEPGPVGALLETAVVLDGLRELRDRLGLGDRQCRYLSVPLADRSNTTVNWIRESVETSLDSVDLTDVFLDHHTYGMTLEHRNATVEERLADVVGRIVDERFEPGRQWEQISAHSCEDCAYTVCCQEYVSSEVAFDG